MYPHDQDRSGCASGKATSAALPAAEGRTVACARNAADECVSLDLGAGDTLRVRARGSASPKAARVTLGVTRR